MFLLVVLSHLGATAILQLSLSSCHVTVVTLKYESNLHMCAFSYIPNSICLLLASCGSASMKLLYCFVLEFKADLILFWLHNTTPAD